MKKTLALLTVMSAFAAAPAMAANVPFEGSVNSTCSINVIANGSLTANVTVDELSSLGGGAGTFEVTTNASIFNLAVQNPTGWGGSTNIPSGDPIPTTTFVATADLDGNTASVVAGSVPIPNGTTPGSVDLVASASGGTFPNGFYETTAVIICE